MKNQKGFSLLETTIVLALLGIVGMVVMKISDEAFKGQKKANIKMDIHSDMIIQENFLSNFVNTLDMHYTFVGPGLPTTLGTFVSRFLIPLPKMCRDLSTQNCQNDTSLMFVNNKTKTNPSLELSCNFNAPNNAFPNPPQYPNPNNYKIFVFNGSAQSYGVSTFNLTPSFASSSGLADLYQPGKIDLSVNSILSVQKGSKASLWRVVQGLQKLAPPTTLAQRLNMMMLMPICFNRINMNTNNNVYYLFATPIKPNHIVPNYFMDLETDPLKLNNVEIMALGRLDSDKTFGINLCKWDDLTEKLTCPTPHVFPKLPKVELSRMDQEFLLPLKPESEIKWYDTGASCSDAIYCNNSEEPLLYVSSLPPGLTIQNLTGHKEMPGVPDLLRGSFSFHKQNYLHRIRFRLKKENKRRDLFIRFY